MQPWANAKSHLGTGVPLKFSDGSSNSPMDGVFASFAGYRVRRWFGAASSSHSSGAGLCTEHGVSEGWWIAVTIP